MKKKIGPIIIAVLILFALFAPSACMPQTELEQAAPERETATETALATAVPTDTAITPAPLATAQVAALPAATLPPTEELIMPEEPTETPAAPPEEESVDPFSTDKQPEPDLNPAVMVWVDQAKQDLAQRQSISTEQIELLSFQTEVWPNAGMGCPQPGMMYAQVMVEGYLIRLKVGDEIYNYHGGGNRAPFLCEQSGPEIAITKQAPKLDLKQTPTKSVPPPRK